MSAADGTREKPKEERNRKWLPWLVSAVIFGMSHGVIHVYDSWEPAPAVALPVKTPTVAQNLASEATKQWEEMVAVNHERATDRIKTCLGSRLSRCQFDMASAVMSRDVVEKLEADGFDASTFGTEVVVDLSGLYK